jgi:hypothetical protein
MRTEHLVESKPALIRLSDQEAQELAALGRQLASALGRWGTPGQQEQRSAINLTPARRDEWTVMVPNAIGVLSTNAVQLVVEPKVPLAHVMHLFGLSGRFPRLGASETRLSTAQELWPLLSTWYIGELEAIIRSPASHAAIGRSRR